MMHRAAFFVVFLVTLSLPSALFGSAKTEELPPNANRSVLAYIVASANLSEGQRLRLENIVVIEALARYQWQRFDNRGLLAANSQNQYQALSLVVTKPIGDQMIYGYTCQLELPAVTGRLLTVMVSDLPMQPSMVDVGLLALRRAISASGRDSGAIRLRSLSLTADHDFTAEVELGN
jgi:hypothetical protein